MLVSLLPSTSEAPCVVCWKPAHGNHFGVTSCRACAAFFRRAVLRNFAALKCRSGSAACHAGLDGKFACKKCRTDRCFEAGMQPEKLQHDRDLVSSTQVPPSMQNFLGRPIFLLCCEPDLAGTQKRFINIKYLIDQAHDFFSKNRGINLENGMNGLEKLSLAFSKTQKSTSTPLIITKIGQAESLFFWERGFLEVAGWLTYIDQFQVLPTRLKLEVLKSIWMVFGRVEKFAKAVVLRKEQRKVCAMTRDSVVDFGNVELDISWCTNYRMDQLTYFFEPADRFFVDYLIDPLTQLQPSIQEVTYIITHICFRHAAKKLTEVIPQLDQIMETLAADLHSYYTNDLKLINYAGRLAKMMRICQLFERDNMDRIERAEIALLFDIFCVEFSHPDFFCGLQ